VGNKFVLAAFPPEDFAGIFGSPQITRQIWDAFPTALFGTSTPPFAKCVIATFWSDFAQLMQERFRTLDFFPDRRSISLGGENLQVVCASYPVASLI
jgi:hypothetical protein